MEGLVYRTPVERVGDPADDIPLRAYAPPDSRPSPRTDMLENTLHRSRAVMVPSTTYAICLARDIERVNGQLRTALTEAENENEQLQEQIIKLKAKVRA